MKYSLISLLLLSNYLFGQSQTDSPSITLCNLVVKEYFSPIKQGGGTHPFGMSYRGTLKKSIAVVWGFPMTRVRFNKEPPIKYLSLETVSGSSPQSMRTIVQQNLESHFGFKVTDKIDSLETWVINKIDSTKLMPFDAEHQGREWGECIYDDSWEAIGAPISELAKECERISNNITVFNEENSGLYYFDIPYAEMKTFDDLNLFLKKYYGLGLTKEKKLVPIKYVTFK